MGSDCTVNIDDGCINLRVAAIIMQGNRILMAGNDRVDFLYSVGGRIKFGETAEEAVRREVFEETGVEMEVDRLGFIHENYFYADYATGNGRLVYEIAYCFYMKVPENFEIRQTPFDGGQRLQWVTADCEKTCYPAFFKTELRNADRQLRHIVTDERNRLPR